MPSLVKDCQVDPRIDLTAGRSYMSGCERNPINIFTLGYGDGDIRVSGGGTATLNNEVGSLYSDYFLNGKSWESTAAAIQGAIEGAFGQWAEYRGLKYSEYSSETIYSATNGMKENPVKDIQ